MAPALQSALRSGKAEGLREVIERNKLLEPQPDGSPSPVQTLLFVSLRTLSAMAEDPAEPGAPAGGYCNDALPPAPRDANRTCEARRIIRTFVREGKGLEALGLLDPLLAGIVDYIVGNPPSAQEPHYELATALSATCSKAYCRTEDTLDLVSGLLAFLEPNAGQPDRPKAILGKLTALFSHPSIVDALGLVADHMGEEELIVFGNLLLDNLMVLPTDPDKFPTAYHRGLEIAINDLLTSAGITRESEQYGDLRRALDEVIGPHEKADESLPHGELRPVLYDLLDPGRPQPVLGPLQKVLGCVRKNDPSSSLMRMVFALAYKEGLVGLDEIFGVLEGLAQMDERASLVTFARLSVAMIREDEEGTRAFRRICAAVLDTRPPAEGERSNAELILPVAADLFEDGAVGEAICVTDTLLHGCAGGERPACPHLAVP